MVMYLMSHHVLEFIKVASKPLPMVLTADAQSRKFSSRTLETRPFMLCGPHIIASMQTSKLKMKSVNP